MLSYTAPSSTWLTPPTDCCFMWLQLYSFQNILSNQFQQRPWPLVVGVHKEGGGGAHVCLLCLWSALWVYERKQQHIESQKIRGHSQPTRSFLPPGLGLSLSSESKTKFVLWVFLHLHLLYCSRLKHISVSVIKYLLKVRYYSHFQIFFFSSGTSKEHDQLSRKLQNSRLQQICSILASCFVGASTNL